MPAVLRRGLAVSWLLATVGAFAWTPATPQAAATPSDRKADFVYCPACGAVNRAGSNFCLKDGAALHRIDPTRYQRGFIRSPSTYSSEEIRRMQQQATESVVRIRVRTMTTHKYPTTYWKDEGMERRHGAMVGKIATSDSDARFSGSGFVISEEGEIVTNAHVASPDGLQAELTVETH